jgi:hypothetical protein
MGVEAHISHRAFILEGLFLALEVPEAFHLVHDLLKFVTVLLLHKINITATNT